MILTLIHKTCIIREYISDTPLSRLSNATKVQFLPKMAKAFNINSWYVREDFNQAKLKLEIPNLLWAGKGDRIGSKLFLVGRSKFRLDVYPSGCDSAEQGMLSAFLHNASNHDVVVDYTITAEGAEPKSVKNLKIVPGVGQGVWPHCTWNFMKAKEVGAALNITVEVKREDISEKKTQQVGSDEEESSSDSGDDDEAVRQLYMQKMQQAQTLKENSIDVSVDDQDSTRHKIDPIKQSQASQEAAEKLDLPKEPSKNLIAKEPTSSDLFGSECDSGSDNEDDEIVSPAKKMRRPIESSSEEELRNKLAGLGKEAADVKEVKRKVAMTKKLKEMEKRREGRATQEDKERKARLGGRNTEKGDEEGSCEEGNGGRRGKGRIKSSDEDEDEDLGEDRRGRRYNKFATSQRKEEHEPSGVSERVGLLDNLLDSQQSLLKRERGQEERKKGREIMKEEDSSSKMEGENKSVLYKGEILQSVGEGLGEGSEYQPPAPHTNLSYRLWNLGWKGTNTPPIQVEHLSTFVEF